VTLAVPAAATPERLTKILRRSGVLGDERVTDVRPESERNTLLSTWMRLRLTYDAGANASLPASLFFKTRLGDSTVTFEESGRREVEFYAQVASLMPAGHVPRCFEATMGADGDWHLLLEDLSASHEIVSEWPLPPTIEQCERIVEAHARFHAFWWADARLGVSVGTLLDAGAFDRFFAAFRQQFSDFANRLGDRLSVDRRRIYERLIEAAPDLLARHRSHRDLTIIHGDAHTWNAFYARDPGRDQVRLFDWDGWRIDVGTDDLAYMMAVHWYPERRRRAGAAVPRAISCGPRRGRRAGLRFRRALAGLPAVGAVADHDSDVAGEPRARSLDLVEPPRAHHERRPRPRLSRAAGLNGH